MPLPASKYLVDHGIFRDYQFPQLEGCFYDLAYVLRKESRQENAGDKYLLLDIDENAIAAIEAAGYKCLYGDKFFREYDSGLKEMDILLGIRTENGGKGIIPIECKLRFTGGRHPSKKLKKQCADMLGKYAAVQAVFGGNSKVDLAEYCLFLVAFDCSEQIKSRLHKISVEHPEYLRFRCQTISELEEQLEIA